MRPGSTLRPIQKAAWSRKSFEYKSCGAICSKPALWQQILTTYHTTFCEIPFPHTLSVLATARKILPSVTLAASVLQRAYGDSLRAKRDYARLAMLFGCGFRRSELVGLELEEIQMRQGHWVVVDLIGLRRTCAKLCHSNGGELEQIQFTRRR